MENIEEKVLEIARSQGILEEVKYLHEECNQSWESIFCDLNPNELTISVNGVDFEMIFVNVGEKTKETSRKRIHGGVCNSYYMGEVPVTQALWEAVMGNNPSAKTPLPSFYIDNSTVPLLEDPNYPVTMVSWSDCQKFIKQLNLLTNYKFRLPTEAEWEFAARGGEKSRKNYEYSGSDDLNEVAVYDPNPDGSNYLLTARPYFAHTRVATKLPNELGLYDMTGLVFEWCEDKRSGGRVIKGGGYSVHYCPISATSAMRSTVHDRYTGLRLSMDAIYQLESKKTNNRAKGKTNDKTAKKKTEESEAQYTKDGKTLRKYIGSSRKSEFVVKDGTRKINKYAFKDAKLKVISIPKSVLEIDIKAFDGCKNLTAVHVDSGNPNYSSVGGVLIDKRRGQSVVMFCPKNKEGEVILNDDVFIIDNKAFKDCKKITSITIPKTVLELDLGMFVGCKKLCVFNVDPNNPNFASDNGMLIDNRNGQSIVVFCSPAKSGEIVLGRGISAIGTKAFYNCSKITSVLIPNSVVSIGALAFSRTGIEDISIPQSVKVIGAYAFASCSSLSKVLLPKDIVEIADGTFQECYALTDISIPSKVKKIGDYAFDFCGLTDVIIPQSVEEIGNGAFQSTELKGQLTIPNSVTKIGEGAFNATNLTHISLPNKLTKIEAMAFAQSRITEVSIPSGVKVIGEEAFLHCSLLEKVSIPNTVNEIGWRAFSYCSILKSVTIPSSVITIHGGTFAGCGYLNTVIIKGRDTALYPNSFCDCSHLKRIVVPIGTLQKYSSMLVRTRGLIDKLVEE